VSPSQDFPSATRALRPELVNLLKILKPGTRIKITQEVRVGSTAKWTAQVQGIFRNVNFLATGLATDRVPEDDIIVVAVHFTKDNGELSSVTLDENSRIEVVPTPVVS
jgi:azurin